MIFALLFIVLFSVLRLFGLGEGAPLFTVSLISGLCALAVAVIIIVSYFVIPPEKVTASAHINYVLFLTVLYIVAAQTGLENLPYSILFYVGLLFAGAFGVAGIGAGVFSLIAMTIQQLAISHVDHYHLVAPLAAGVLLLVAGTLLWSRRASNTEKETTDDRSYHELANQLSQESGKADGVINAIQDGVLSLNKAGIIELVNPAAQSLLGWSSGDSLRLSYQSVFKMHNTKNQVVDDANDPVKKALTTNQPVANDSFSLETRSGKTFMASISVSPIGKQGSGVIIVFRDVTAERSNERQRAEFISTASHEMRTPVASIEGYLELALNPSISTVDDKARDYINKAHASAQHLGRLFSDLLDVSKADDSRLKNTPKTVDVVPFIHDIVQGFETSADDKHLRLVYKPIPDDDSDFHDPIRKLNPMYYAYVDNDHLREVVQNLVENAIKYTPHGDVTVDVTGDTEHITISVTDTGIGIPLEDQPHLFQKFYRIDNSDTREIGGTGLGLYLCRRLAEAIGGRLWVESEYKHGSTFFLEIPRVDSATAQQHIKQEKENDEKEKQDENNEAAQEEKKTKEAAMLAGARELAHRMEQEQKQTQTAPASPVMTPPAEPPVQYKPTAVAESQPIVTAPVSPQQAVPVANATPSPQPLILPVTPSNPSRYRPNIPLDVIEAHPDEYTAKRLPDGSIAVPERKR